MGDFLFKILTYNVFGSLYLPSTRRRFVEIGRQLVKMAEDQKIDVICLQETFFSSWRNKHLIEPWLQRFSFHAGTAKQRGYLLNSGLVTLSQGQITQSEFRGFRQSKGVDGFANKGVLFTRVLMPDGTEIDVYNTHTQASYFSQKIRSAVRISQVREILEFVCAHSTGKNHVLLVGDLNFTEDNEEYEILKGEGGFTDFMRTLYPSRGTHPMHTIKKSHPNKEKKIDHVFMRLAGNPWVGFDKSTVKVLDLGLSDHRAVFAEIAIQR